MAPMLPARALGTRFSQQQPSLRHNPASRSHHRSCLVEAVRSGRPTGKVRQRRDDYDDDDELGWWEKPGGSEDANPLDNISPWQTRRLEQAYAVGRRKVQVSTLSKDLDLDRSIVTEWFKRFSKLPESEQNTILAERRRELKNEEAKPKPSTSKAPKRDDAKSLADVEEEKGAGFIPYQVRKTMPRDKKYKQDVLRTLEMVYERTPFPPDDVIRSLWDLHKIPRSMAIEWFSNKRRESQPSTNQATSPSTTASKESAKPQKASKQKVVQSRAEQVAAKEPKPAMQSAAGALPAPAPLQKSLEASTSAPASKKDAPASSASGVAAERKPKKMRFDDVKVVVTNDTPVEPEPSTSAVPQVGKEQTIENLVEAYGELLFKAAKKDKLDELMDLGEDRPGSWREGWRYHRYVNGLPKWRRINWSAWYDRLAYNSDNVDELQMLDANDETGLMVELLKLEA